MKYVNDKKHTQKNLSSTIKKWQNPHNFHNKNNKEQIQSHIYTSLPSHPLLGPVGAAIQGPQLGALGNRWAALRFGQMPLDGSDGAALSPASQLQFPPLSRDGVRAAFASPLLVSCSLARSLGRSWRQKMEPSFLSSFLPHLLFLFILVFLFFLAFFVT